jgi:hypothetical protein
MRCQSAIAVLAQLEQHQTPVRALVDETDRSYSFLIDRLRSCPTCKTTPGNARQAALALR